MSVGAAFLNGTPTRTATGPRSLPVRAPGRFRFAYRLPDGPHVSLVQRVAPRP